MTINDNDKFAVRVFLSVIAVNPDPTKKDNSKLLLIDTGTGLDFPSNYLDKTRTTKDVATSLLEEYTGVTLDWAVLFPFGVIDDINPEKSEIYVLYGVFIPDVTRIRKTNTKWVSYQELNNSDKNMLTKKITEEVIWRNI